MPEVGDTAGADVLPVEVLGVGVVGVGSGVGSVPGFASHEGVAGG